MSAQEGAEQRGRTGAAPGWGIQEQSNNCPETRSNRAEKQRAGRVIRSLGVSDTKHIAEKTAPSQQTLNKCSRGRKHPLQPCCACQHRHATSRAHLDGAGAQAQVLLRSRPGRVRRQWRRGSIRRGW